MKIKLPSGQKLTNTPYTTVKIDFGRLPVTLNRFFGLYGDLQRFADSEVLNGILDYMPFHDGMMRQNTKRFTDIGSGVVFTPGPQARYLYYGILYVDPTTGSSWAKHGAKKVPAEPETLLNYHGGGKSGAKWDVRWKADNLHAYVKSLQNFVKQNF